MVQSIAQFNAVKITQPSLGQYIQRERLYAQLDAHRNKPVIWIVGPGGSGKTTLISSYLEHQKLPAIWFQADEGDGDAATFFHYLALAARKTNPRKHKTFPVLTQEYQFGLPTFSRRFFEQVFDCINKPAAFVIDNYQEIPAASNVHELIRAGLDTVPDHFTVILLSRHAPPELYSRLQANQQMGQIDWHDLSLTQAETQDIVSLKLKHTHDLSPVIHQRIHGWVAGLVLILEWANQTGEELSVLNDLSRESIFEYFAGEVLRHTDTETRDLLLKSSLLPKMSARLVTELSNNSKANTILIDLARQSYFVTRHSGREITYQYHPLFREFLLKRAAEKYGRNEFDSLRIHAGRLLEADGQTEAAIESYMNAGDYENLIRALYNCAESMLDTGRTDTLLQWILSVPETLRLQHPMLMLWNALCSFKTDIPAALRLAEQAFHLFRQAGDAAGVYYSLVWAINATITSWGVLGIELDNWLGFYDETKTQSTDTPDVDMELYLATSLVSAFGWRQPDHPDVAYWRKRADYLLSNTLGDRARLHSTIILTLMDVFFGDFESAKIRASQVEQFLKKPINIPFYHAFGISALGCVVLFQGNTLACCELANQAVQFASETGIKTHEFFSAGYAFESLMMCGDLLNARPIYQQLTEQQGLLPMILRSEYHKQASMYEFLRGDYNSASKHGELAVESADTSGATIAMVQSRICLAEALFELNDTSRARTYLNEALSTAQRGYKYLLHYAKLVNAFYAFKIEDESLALAKLRDAFEYGNQQGYTCYYYWRQDALAELCVKALEHGIEVDYTQQLIRGRNLVPTVAPQHLNDWPWRIRIHTFGEFKVLVEEERVSMGRKTPKKVFSLLKAIISLGGNTVHESQLIDSLWPDEDADSASSSLKTTLHRLRQMLGNEAIILREGRYGINSRYCWVDAWAFDRLLKQAESNLVSGNIDNAQADTERALALHEGVYLAGDLEQFWALDMRENLRTRFINRIQSLGSRLEAIGDIGNAINWYLKGLKIDVLAEPLYQGLMRCYIDSDQHSDAAKIYQRCRKMLTTSLSVEPSAVTKALYQKIIH